MKKLNSINIISCIQHDVIQIHLYVKFVFERHDISDAIVIIISTVTVIISSNAVNSPLETGDGCLQDVEVSYDKYLQF